MLKDVIRSDFMNARKVGDHATKDALEAIIADILKREKSEAGHVVGDGEVIEGITKEIKVQKEVIEFCKDKAKDKAEEAAKKIEVLTKYLPKQLTEEEVLKIIEEADTFADASPRTKGMIIKAVMPKIAGKFDKSLVNGLVEKHLANK